MSEYKHYTLTEIKKAIKKLEIITDKVVDLQDMGLGDIRTQAIQDNANRLLSWLHQVESKRYRDK